jgi:hypothetical protein
MIPIMKKNIFVITIFLITACSSIPDVAVPNIPLIGSDESLEDTGLDQDPEARLANQLSSLNTRGNGFLSFSYSEGHLPTITVVLQNERIMLSRGQTVIRKLPVGRHVFEVSGRQKDTEKYTAILNYDGDTDQYEFFAPEPQSIKSRNSVDRTIFDHGEGILIVGSTLVNPYIDITKLDQPTKVFELCEMKNGKRECVFENNYTTTSPLRIFLPEGKYLLNHSGMTKEVYINDDTIYSFELASDGFQESKITKFK